MAEITKEQMDAAEADYLATKDAGDDEQKREAAQAFADLRRAYKLQLASAGQRDPNAMVVVEDETQE